jgi:PAS domain S-box-containing protein
VPIVLGLAHRLISEIFGTFSMQRFSNESSVALRYSVALLTVAVAVTVRHALTPLTGNVAAPFAFVTAAVMLSAWLVGTGPAAIAMIVGLALVNKFFLGITPAVQSSANIVHIATYLFVSCAAILMSAAYRRSSSKYVMELQHSEGIGQELLRERDALREANEKFRAVAETASSAILIHDGDRLRYVNQASERLFGYNRDDLLSRNMWEIIHPDERRLLRERAAARLRGEKAPNRYELKIITKSGEERWLETGATLISFEGKPCILANAFDITDRKRAEESLRTREEHYRAAMEAGKVGTWEWDMKQNVVFFSDNWYALTSKLDRQYEFAGSGRTRPYIDFALWKQAIHEDDRSSVDAAIDSALEHDTKYQVEYRVREKGTNEVRWLAGLGRVLRDNQGNPLRMIGAAADITERRRAEEVLRNTEKLAAAGQLAASIAHEINNPLEAVMNLVFLARTTGEANDEGTQLLETAEDELRRAAHLTKQTLGFYRDSTSPASFNVADVVDEVLSLYARRIESRGVKVRKDYFDAGQMHGMIGEIRQAISNLVANALDAMSHSGGILHVRVRRTMHSRDGYGLRIMVADNGEGIRAQSKSRIFEPFFTTKPETGAGLGLWLTKNIVEKHSGTIRVFSSSSGTTGTAFLVAMPVGDSHSMSAISAA